MRLLSLFLVLSLSVYAKAVQPNNEDSDSSLSPYLQAIEASIDKTLPEIDDWTEQTWIFAGLSRQAMTSGNCLRALKYQKLIYDSAEVSVRGAKTTRPKYGIPKSSNIIEAIFNPSVRKKSGCLEKAFEFGLANEPLFDPNNELYSPGLYIELAAHYFWLGDRERADIILKDTIADTVQLRGSQEAIGVFIGYLNTLLENERISAKKDPQIPEHALTLLRDFWAGNFVIENTISHHLLPTSLADLAFRLKDYALAAAIIRKHGGVRIDSHLSDILQNASVATINELVLPKPLGDINNYQIGETFKRHNRWIKPELKPVVIHLLEGLTNQYAIGRAELWIGTELGSLGDDESIQYCDAGITKLYSDLENPTYVSDWQRMIDHHMIGACLYANLGRDMLNHPRVQNSDLRQSYIAGAVVHLALKGKQPDLDYMYSLIESDAVKNDLWEDFYSSFRIRYSDFYYASYKSFPTMNPIAIKFLTSILEQEQDPKVKAKYIQYMGNWIPAFAPTLEQEAKSKRTLGDKARHQLLIAKVARDNGQTERAETIIKDVYQSVLGNSELSVYTFEVIGRMVLLGYPELALNIVNEVEEASERLPLYYSLTSVHQGTDWTQADNFFTR